MDHTPFTVVKASGEREPYDSGKLRLSLERAGASSNAVSRVEQEIHSWAKDGVSTKKLYRRAFKLLSSFNTSAAAKYNLRRGVMDLGPAGFLFEQFLADVLRAYGYDVETNQMLKGSCVSHEVDLVIRNSADIFAGEAKYHNDTGLTTDIQVVMYAHARVWDIRGQGNGYEGAKAWILTNTKFTRKAITYAECKHDVRLTGWNYPRHDSLADLIARKNLYPVTVLPSVGKSTRELFARKGLLFAKDVAELTPETMSRTVGISMAKARSIAREAADLSFS